MTIKQLENEVFTVCHSEEFDFQMSLQDPQEYLINLAGLRDKYL